DLCPEIFDEDYPSRMYPAWGYLLLRIGDPIAALRQLRRAIKGDPAEFFPQVARADCHLALGRLKWASRSFERALSDGTKFYNYKPNTARIEALSRWAVALSDAGLTEQALARADEACRIDENAYWALFSKGYVFDKFGAYEQ